MRIESSLYRPTVAETENDVSVARARPGIPDGAPVDSTGEVAEVAALPAAPAVPWMDPALGGRTALGSPGRYLPALESLCAELSQRADPVARFGLAAIRDELDNHALLNGHLNSLIAS